MSFILTPACDSQSHTRTHCLYLSDQSHSGLGYLKHLLEVTPLIAPHGATPVTNGSCTSPPTVAL